MNIYYDYGYEQIRSDQRNITYIGQEPEQAPGGLHWAGQARLVCRAPPVSPSYVSGSIGCRCVKRSFTNWQCWRSRRNRQALLPTCESLPN